MSKIVALESRIVEDGSILVRRPETDIMDSSMGLIPDTPLEELLAEGYAPAGLPTGTGICGYDTVSLWTPKEGK